MGTLNGALWGYGVPSRVMRSLKGSLWGYGAPKWGSVGLWGSPVGLWGSHWGYGVPKGVFMALWGPQVGLCGVLGVPSGVMGSLRMSLWRYGNPKWDYRVPSGVMGSLKGS